MKSHKNNPKFRTTLRTQSLACWLCQAEWYFEQKQLWVLVVANLSVIRRGRCLQKYVLEDTPSVRHFKDPWWTQAHSHLHSSESLKENRELCCKVNTCSVSLWKNTGSISWWNYHVPALWYSFLNLEASWMSLGCQVKNNERFCLVSAGTELAPRKQGDPQRWRDCLSEGKIC